MSRPFKRGGGGKRRDVAEKPIVDAGRRVGAEVWRIGGTGLPDLLVRFRGRLEAGEVKSDGGRETKNQGAWPIWRTPEDLLRAIGAIPEPLHICRQPGFDPTLFRCLGCDSEVSGRVARG